MPAAEVIAQLPVDESMTHPHAHLHQQVRVRVRVRGSQRWDLVIRLSMICLRVRPGRGASCIRASTPPSRKRWLPKAMAFCEVHATPRRAIPSARVRGCLNLVRLLIQVASYERKPQCDTYRSILR
jgi:hypothetical protein